MEKLFMTVLEMSLRGCVVIAAVLLARLLLRKAPAVTRFALWGLVAVALLVPVRLQSSLSLMPAAPEETPRKSPDGSGWAVPPPWQPGPPGAGWRCSGGSGQRCA